MPPAFAEDKGRATACDIAARCLGRAINVAACPQLSHDDAYGFVQTLLTEASIALVPITAEMTPIAIAAHRDFGKGRHPAALNFGDCFAYAAARHYRLPLCSGRRFQPDGYRARLIRA